MLLNNSRILHVAKQIAARVRRELPAQSSADRGEAFVRRAYRLTTGLAADEATTRLLAELAESGASGEVDVCHVLLNSNQFLFVE